VNVCPFPAGADFFCGLVRLTRVSAPSHQWMDRESLEVLPIQNQWIPFFGAVSMLLETGQGFKRMLHVCVDGSNIVLKKQQSVSVAPGGWGTFSIINEPFEKQGGTWENIGTRGLPIHEIELKETNRPSSAGSGGSDLPSGATDSPLQNHRLGHNDPASTVDPTNYRSSYQVDIRLRIGRRS
jgi:hypothetical protein